MLQHFFQTKDIKTDEEIEQGPHHHIYIYIDIKGTVIMIKIINALFIYKKSGS